MHPFLFSVSYISHGVLVAMGSLWPLCPPLLIEEEANGICTPQKQGKAYDMYTLVFFLWQIIAFKKNLENMISTHTKDL
jgi:hypothetical protein